MQLYTTSQSILDLSCLLCCWLLGGLLNKRYLFNQMFELTEQHWEGSFCQMDENITAVTTRRMPSLLFCASIIEEDLSIARWQVRRNLSAILLSWLDWCCSQDAFLCRFRLWQCSYIMRFLCKHVSSCTNIQRCMLVSFPYLSFVFAVSVLFSVDSASHNSGNTQRQSMLRKPMLSSC